MRSSVSDESIRSLDFVGFADCLTGGQHTPDEARSRYHTGDLDHPEAVAR